MECPKCQKETFVLDTRKRKIDGIIRRRKRCSNIKCLHNFTTYEVYSEEFDNYKYVISSFEKIGVRLM